MQKVLYILGELDDRDVEWLIAAGERRKHGRGERLIEEGRANHQLFILLDGHVSVTVRDGGEVDVLGSGEILGETSLVDARPPVATVTAVEECYTLAVDHKALRRHIDEDHGFGMRFYRALATFLSRRLRNERTPDLDREIGVLADREQDDELDEHVLDHVHVAGARFDRLLKRLMGGRPGEGSSE